MKSDQNKAISVHVLWGSFRHRSTPVNPEGQYHTVPSYLRLATDDVGICRQLIGYNSSRCMANGSLPLLGLLAARQLSTRFEEWPQ